MAGYSWKSILRPYYCFANLKLASLALLKEKINILFKENKLIDYLLMSEMKK